MAYHNEIYKSLLDLCQIIMQTYFKSRLVKFPNMLQIYIVFKDVLDKCYIIVMQIYLKCLLVKCALT